MKLVRLIILSVCLFFFAVSVQAEVSLLSSENESSIVVSDEHPFGKFYGEISTKWLPDGRKMELLDTLVFVDARGKVWDAPKGHIVDGASIPQEVWSLVGGPYSGKYRDASVIHDVACDRKDRPWQLVHLVFYEAMLASGVSKEEADTKYFAVQNYGPRWGDDALEKRLTDEEYKAVLNDPKKKSRYISEILDDAAFEAKEYISDSAVGFGRYVQRDLVNDYQSITFEAKEYISDNYHRVGEYIRNDLSDHIGLLYSQITLKRIIWILGTIVLLGVVMNIIRRIWVYALGLLVILSVVSIF